MSKYWIIQKPAGLGMSAALNTHSNFLMWFCIFFHKKQTSKKIYLMLLYQAPSFATVEEAIIVGKDHAMHNFFLPVEPLPLGKEYPLITLSLQWKLSYQSSNTDRDHWCHCDPQTATDMNGQLPKCWWTADMKHIFLMKYIFNQIMFIITKIKNLVHSTL